MFFTKTKPNVKYDYDVTNIQRNCFISEREVNFILQTKPSDRHYGLAKLSFIDWLQKQVDLLIKEGKLDEQLIVKQEDWGIIFLGGIDAVRYCDSRANSHIRNAKKQNKKLFSISRNDIAHNEIDEYNHYVQEAKIRDSILNKASKTYC